MNVRVIEPAGKLDGKRMALTPPLATRPKVALARQLSCWTTTAAL